jgi:hypothetical protein
MVNDFNLINDINVGEKLQTYTLVVCRLLLIYFVVSRAACDAHRYLPISCRKYIHYISSSFSFSLSIRFLRRLSIFTP